MSKNLIVCADGTGNRGGSTPSSNVYKIYKAIDKHHKDKRPDSKVDQQIVFYDNGVGTEKNKLLRLLGGAFGFGFEDNVCDLYKFLARNYEPGDNIYFFGFSRGASTVRACNGFISTCGLAKGIGLRNREIDTLVHEAFKAYRNFAKFPAKAQLIKESEISHGEIDIHFIGIWDTVVALGFPKRTDKTGPVSTILNSLFWLVEKVADKLFPHGFYNYRLTARVKNAYQALAIDDERTAFWPHVWREKESGVKNIEQVWFAGMHSNVGGGYGRSGTASIALHWMMLRAEECGLTFYPDAVQQAYEDSNVHGRIHNSRDGFGVMYRYHPREIEKLCAGRLIGNIRLHSSVLDRIKQRTANYAPGQIPAIFDVVGSEIPTKPITWNPGSTQSWGVLRAEIDSWVLKRKRLYGVMLAFLAAIVFSPIVLNLTGYCATRGEGGIRYLVDFLDYILPEWFDNLITFGVVEHPMAVIFTVIGIIIYILTRARFRRNTVDACERLRNIIINYDLK